MKKMEDGKWNVGACGARPDGDGRRRKSIRLNGYDYSRKGAYFVTVCIFEKMCILGKIKNGEMILNEMGIIVQQCWNNIKNHFDCVNSEDFVVMPNHIHGIVIIERRGLIHQIPNMGNTSKGVMNHNPKGVMNHNPKGVVNHNPKGVMNHNPKGVMNHARTATAAQWGLMCNPNITLGKIIRHFKAKCTRLIRNYNYAGFQWQRNYYEHIIRNDDDLNRIREYIKNNPIKWEEDENNHQKHVGA